HWQSLSGYAWFDFLGLDALYYDEWAKRLMRDGWQGKDPYFMGPLYPYLLSIVYSVFGTGLDAVRHLQMFLSVGSVALIHFWVRRLGGARTAMVASGAAALYGPFIYYASSILYPTLTVFLATSLLLLLYEAAARKSVRLALAAGAVMGLYALGRGNILLFAPPAFFWLLAAWGRPQAPRWSGWKRGLQGGLALTAGTVLLILPATVHNLRTGDPTTLTTNGGLNFYIGNGPMANGGHVTPVLHLERPDGRVDLISADLTKDVECRTEAELATGRPMKYTEVSAFWADETWKFIRNNPGTFASRLVMKFAHFWSTYEIPQIEHFGYFRQFSLPLRGPVLTFGIIGPLALLGMALVLRRPGPWLLPLLFVVAYSTSIILFFVLARYRLPVLPALLPFAAMAALRIVDWGTERRFVPIGGSVAALAGLSWLMHANFYGIDETKGIAQIVYRHGIVADSQGDWDTAIAHYEEALRLKPDYPKGHLNLGVDLARVGRRDEAMAHLAEAERLDPTYYRAPYNQGSLLEDTGRHDEAAEAYARAVELEPRYLVARLALAEMHLVAGNTEAAREELRFITAYNDRWNPESNRAAQARAAQWTTYLDRRDELARTGHGECFEANRTFRLAEVARQRGRIQEALGVLRFYFEEGGACAEAYAVLGRILAGIGEVAGADDSLRRALAVDPTYPQVRVTLAQLAASQGDAETAATQLQEEIRLRPEDPAPYLELGLVEERLRKDPEAAERWFRRFAEAGGNPALLQQRRGGGASGAAPQDHTGHDHSGHDHSGHDHGGTGR
ncbi:MAG: tetratricopeptide repeat protein, partial [Gemmatimonadetes bacterium]|nr:tetratricopeptide repeat protein [Gemmatimonadota bacterium]